jgi:hypothetical protein
MDRQRKTIELLQLLGDDVAEMVLAQLDPGQATRIRSELSQTSGPVVLRPKRQRELLDDSSSSTSSLFETNAQHLNCMKNRSRNRLHQRHPNRNLLRKNHHRSQSLLRSRNQSRNRFGQSSSSPEIHSRIFSL